MADAYISRVVANGEELDQLLQKCKTGVLPAVLDDDKEDVYISTARTLRLGSTGRDFNDDAQGELGLGEISVTDTNIGMAVRKDSVDNTRRYFRLYDSNAYPNIARALRLRDEDDAEYVIFGEHNPALTVLWKNADPTESFAAQTIDIANLKSNELVVVDFAASIGGNGRTTCFLHIGESTPVAAPGAGRLNERIVTVRADAVNFGGGRYYSSYGSTSRTNSNDVAIPLRISKLHFG